MLELLSVLGSATQDQKKRIGVGCRGVIGLAISGQLGGGNDPTQRIILDFRNRALARKVADSEAARVYVTYGAAQFPGFFVELRKHDPGFRIRVVKGVHPMSLPVLVNLPRSALFGPAR